MHSLDGGIAIIEIRRGNYGVSPSATHGDSRRGITTRVHAPCRIVDGCEAIERVRGEVGLLFIDEFGVDKVSTTDPRVCHRESLGLKKEKRRRGKEGRGDL